MKLLLVDDDLHVIQGIRQNIEWEKLGIDCAYSALGASAARKVLAGGPIDIMICDIEMPQETGLDLLAWIREEGMEVQTIFLTSYAKFEYAQRAVKLDSLEYILKPVDYKQLQKALSLAVDKAVNSRQNEVFKENNRYWEQNRQNVTEYFWNGVLSGAIASDEESMSRRMEECGLADIRDRVFLPIVIQLVHDVEEEQDHLAKLIRGFCERYFAVESNEGILSNEKILSNEFQGKITDHLSMIMLSAKMNTDVGELEQYVDQFMKGLADNLNSAGLEVLCGVGMWSTAGLVREDVDNIRAMMYESPRNTGRILYLQRFEPVNMMYEVPDLENWWSMMKSGQSETLKAAVEKYLSILNGQQKLSTRNLQQLGLDLTQMVYSYLGSMNIYAHMLFDNEENHKLYGRAALSSHNMMRYLEYLLSKALEYKNVVERPSSIVDTLKDYMNCHFQDNISRDDLSRLVFLNPDYLSRLFKKETGRSISGYLIQKRIELAKELLAGTRMPVSVISSQVGYDNFAYFTKVFKEKTGMSPNEYRKNCQRGGA